MTLRTANHSNFLNNMEFEEYNEWCDKAVRLAKIANLPKLDVVNGVANFDARQARAIVIYSIMEHIQNSAAVYAELDSKDEESADIPGSNLIIASSMLRLSGAMATITNPCVWLAYTDVEDPILSCGAVMLIDLIGTGHISYGFMNQVHRMALEAIKTKR